MLAFCLVTKSNQKIQERNMLQRSLNKCKKYYKSNSDFIGRRKRLLCISNHLFIHSLRRPAFLSGLRSWHFVSLFNIIIKRRTSHSSSFSRIDQKQKMLHLASLNQLHCSPLYTVNSFPDKKQVFLFLIWYHWIFCCSQGLG